MGDRAKGQVKDVLLNEGGTGLADVSGTSDAGGLEGCWMEQAYPGSMTAFNTRTQCTTSGQKPAEQEEQSHITQFMLFPRIVLCPRLPEISS